MTVADLIEKLRQFPENLELHVMADLESDLVDIGSVHLISKPFIDEPFVVIELEQCRRPVQNPANELHSRDDAEDPTAENRDATPLQKQ